MANVYENNPLYDSVIICSSLYGNETTAQGWFTSIAAFGAQQEHRFFKNRNQANVGLAYNNMLSQDRADYAYHAVSLGVIFQAPITPFEVLSGDVTSNRFLSSFWLFDLPNHVSVSFKLGQDIRLEANGYHVPSGYGAIGGGMTQGQDDYSVAPGNNSLTQAVWNGTQGTPTKENRYVFEKEIDIPRNQTFEVKLTISEYARSILKDCGGPGSYDFVADVGEGTTTNYFPCRYGIQVSLYGVREVQQRGAMHA
jgi:hypothetical protein